MSENASASNRSWPACIGVEEVSRILGWPLYFFPVLVRAGHLKPLGRPSQNSRKWFATSEIMRLSHDIGWLDKAVRIVEKHVHDLNAKQRGRDLDAVPASDESLAA
ncbi:MAG TPA: hypothetical protein PKA41_08420 [Verrucomicrobiota bacterium]|nr:hypothetical protein [Verrucomicrobiota bacterium]